MIPAINVPAAPASASAVAAATATGATSGGASVSNHIREEEFNDDYYDDYELDEVDWLRGYTACLAANASGTDVNLPRLFEKSVIIHRDENGFGLRLKGQAPVFVEHVHENGAAWRAGVRRLDRISKVNGTQIASMDHKDVVLMFKSCTRFVGLTLLTPMIVPADRESEQLADHQQRRQLQHYQKGLAPQVAAATMVSFGADQKYLQCPISKGVDGVSRRIYLRTASQSHIIGSIPPSAPAPVFISNNGNNISSHQHQCPQNMSSSLSCKVASNSGAQYRLTTKTTIVANSPQKQDAADSSGARASYSPNNTTSSQEQQHVVANKANNRRISVGDHENSNRRNQKQQRASPSCEPHDSRRRPDKQVVVCINCRTQIIRNQHPQDTHSFANATCLHCQLKFQGQQQQQHLAENTALRSRAGPAKQMLAAEHQQRQRSYGSLKDQRQKEAEMMTTMKVASDLRQQQRADTHADDADNNQTRQQQLKKPPTQANYRLSQSISTSSLPADTSALPRKPTTNRRLEIIREFIDTEKTHTERLRCLDELFYRPLKSGGFMTTEQLRMVFSCHKTLYKIHRQIYRILLSANYNLYTTEPMVGSALLEIFEGDLKRRLERAACLFCVAQSSNADLLNKLTRRDTKVGEFLAQVTSQQMVGRLGIKDLLASCFQRLTKYPLLLENLLKATPQPEPVEARKALARPRLSLHCSKGHSNDEAVSSSKATTGDELKEEENEEDKVEEEEKEEEEELEEIRNSRRMLAISLAEERELIERALQQSRQILVRVNDSVKVAASHNKLKEIWKRTEKYPGVPLIDISKEQIVHDGLLTLRLLKRSFDVHVLLLSNYIIILTRESQDKYRLKFFTPEGKSSSNNAQSVYSPVFVIDEHLTTRDAATDENGFYLLCKRKDDSRIYEFASRSPAERIKWRDRIQWTIERQMSKNSRRPSCESSITKSSSEISTRLETDEQQVSAKQAADQDRPAGEISHQDSSSAPITANNKQQISAASESDSGVGANTESNTESSTGALASNSANQSSKSSSEPTKIEGTISYVEDDGIVMPSKMESSWALVDQAIQVNIIDSLRKPVPSN